jgi:hypothetical protein
MRWAKQGLVFRPDGRCDWMASHAAVPFAVPLEGTLARVYFSSRDRQGRSSVAWLVIDLERPQRILDLATAPVLGPGRLGAFDDSGAMLSWIVPGTDCDRLYYIGWNLGVTVPFRNAIGLAIGDGRGGFQRAFEGPIVDRSPTEPYFTASACVLREDDAWRMWYLSCVGWEPHDGGPRHRYHIKYATSADGVAWERRGVIAIDFGSPAEYAISRPSVIKDGSVYRMWYSYRGESYRIGYAESLDGMSWQRRDELAGIDVSSSGWDSEMVEYPHVFDGAGGRFLLYNGNGYGRTGFGLAVLEER